MVQILLQGFTLTKVLGMGLYVNSGQPLSKSVLVKNHVHIGQIYNMKTWRVFDFVNICLVVTQYPRYLKKAFF